MQANRNCGSGFTPCSRAQDKIDTADPSAINQPCPTSHFPASAVDRRLHYFSRPRSAHSSPCRCGRRMARRPSIGPSRAP